MEAVHYHGHRQPLRERFLKSGFAGFAEHEIVELLLTLCIPRRDVKPAAKALLDRFGTLRAILDAPFADLQQVSGIGEVAPVALRLIRETATLYLQQQAEAATVLASPDSLTTFWRARKERKPALESDPHTYERPGKHNVMVKVADVFGSDTSQALEVEVK